MKIKKIQIKQNGQTCVAELKYSETPPWSVNLVVNCDININAESEDLFEALIDIREKASQFGISILCNGANKHVFPSSMSRNMGGGVMAYRLEKGKQARRADLVNIFDVSDEDQIVSVDEQKEFYKEWLESLK